MNNGAMDSDWEYLPLRLPPSVSRITAATQLAIHAEFAGWELSTVRLYADGTRRVLLRRKQRAILAQSQNLLPNLTFLGA